MITYAKVGGPPNDWDKYQVRDLDSGKLVLATEVNTEEGWVVVQVNDPDFSGTVKRTGRFAIERQP